SISLPPACAVFSIASKTVNRVNVHAWQPMPQPPCLDSSGTATSARTEVEKIAAMHAAATRRQRVLERITCVPTSHKEGPVMSKEFLSITVDRRTGIQQKATKGTKDRYFQRVS